MTPYWVTSRHPTQRRRKHPYLVDVVELGRTFRDNYLSGLKRLLAKSLLKTEGSQAWLQDKSRQDAWLSELQELDWNVFIQGPPHAQSDPAHVLKYLARYMTGGPISNHRILGADEDNAWFMARSRDKRNKSRPFKLRGSEFVRRWAMHILPRGYTRSRSYGGFHSRKRRTYLQLCKTLLPPQPEEHEPTAAIPNACEPEAPKCRRCRKPLTLVLDQPRPSWKTIFTRTIYEDASLYSPRHQISARAPPASPDV